MALFSKQAKVNVEDVIAFRTSVTSFAQTTHDIGNDMINTLTEMEETARQRAEELDKIAKSYDQLYSSIKQLESEISRHITSLKQQLSHTPKQIEKKYTDDEGKEKVKKVPNPAYKELESKIQKENSRLFEVKELAWKVYNEVSHSRRVAGELASAASELKSILPELQENARKAVLTTERALHALENTIRAINNYISFQFQII